MSITRSPIEFHIPPSRMLWGDAHKAQLQYEEDRKTPKKVKTGKNAGQDLYLWVLGVGVPKRPGVDWRQEPWGQAIYNEAVACWPAGQHAQSTFSFKVTDGDSTDLDTNQVRQCDKPGRPGHWIVSLSGASTPDLLETVTTGQAKPTQHPDFAQPGDIIEIIGECKSNESLKKPGMYLNARGICFRGYSPLGRIQNAKPVDTSKFGSGVAAGAAATMPGVMAPDTAASAAPVTPAPVTPPPVPQQTAVTPSATFVPQPPAAVALAPVAPPPAVRQVYKDGAVAGTLEQFVSAGWSEATLAQNGYVVQ